MWICFLDNLINQVLRNAGFISDIYNQIWCDLDYGFPDGCFNISRLDLLFRNYPGSNCMRLLKIAGILAVFRVYAVLALIILMRLRPIAYYAIF